MLFMLVCLALARELQGILGVVGLVGTVDIAAERTCLGTLRWMMVRLEKGETFDH